MKHRIANHLRYLAAKLDPQGTQARFVYTATSTFHNAGAVPVRITGVDRLGKR